MDDLDKTKEQLIEELRTCQGRLESKNRELQQVERELEKTRSACPDLFDFSPVAYFTLNLQGTILRANPMSALILGAEADRMIDQPFSRFVFPEDHHIFAFFCDKLKQGHSKQRCNIRLTREDRTQFYAQLEGIGYFDEDEQSENLLIAAIDYSTSKHMEERINSVKEQWEKIFDAMPDIITILDAEHRIVWMNKAMAAYLGITRQDAIGTKCYQAVHGMNEPPAYCPHAKAMKDGQDHEAEVIESRLGGIFDVSVTPLVDTQNKLIGSIHIARDISARRRMEAELIQSEQLYRNFFETSRDCVFITTLDGGIVDFNDAGKEVLGFSLENSGLPQGMNVSTVYAHPEDREAHVRAILERGFCKDYPVDFRKTDGSVINTLTTTVCRKDQQGNIIGFQGTIRDITDLKRSKELLQESEEKYRLIFNNSPIGMMHFDSDGIIEDCNQKFLDILGPSREQVIGLNLMTSLGNQTVKDAVRSALSGIMGTYEGDYSSVVSGKTIWAKLVCSPLTSSDGFSLGGIALVEDLTAQKQAEAALRLSEEQFSKAFQASPDGILISRMSDGQLVEVNDGFSLMTGYSKDEALRNSTIVLNLWEDPRDREKVVATLLDKKMVRDLEVGFRTKSGEILSALYSGDIIFVGGEAHVLSVVRDVTQRKRWEEELHYTLQRLYTILSSSYAGLLLVANEGQVEFANQAFCDIFNIEGPSSTMKGLSAPQMIEKIRNVYAQPIEAVARIAQIVAQNEVVKGEEVSLNEGRAVLRDYFPISIEGKPYGRLWSHTDITALKRAERERESFRSQLLQSQKMEAVGTLAAGIAHDFNNMLQAILGYSEMLLGEKNKGEPGYEELQRIVSTALEARDLVQKIRLFSRRADIQPVAVDLNHQFRELTKLLSHTLLKTIDVNVQLEDNLGAIKADPALMDQMVTNLAINAVEAMPDGGIFTIKTQNTLLDIGHCESRTGLKPGPHVCLTISDTGKGMTKELVDRIFDPFFSTKQRDYRRGTGLGLSIVKGIVDEHRGHITVESEVGKGTTFRVYFPILAVQQAPPAQVEAKAGAGTLGETILLVEDEALVRDLVITLLERFGYKVIAVRDGQEAVEVYAKEHENIALVILDIVMPRMDGKECLQELLKINPAVKVLISSGVAQDDRVKEVVDLGARGSLLKPYGMKMLQEKVREVLDSA